LSQSKIKNQHSSFVNLSVEASAKSDPASSKSRITDLFPMLFPRHRPSFETPKSPKERRTPIRHASETCRVGYLTAPSECVSPLSAFQNLSFSAFSHILLLPLNPDYDPIIVAPHEGS